MRCWIVATVMALVSAAEPARAEVNAPRLDALFEKYAAPDRPGCAVAATQNGRIVTVRAYGAAVVETSTPNTPQTVFHLASLSKMFTGYAVKLLEAEGRLSLDDDVRRHVPELRDFGAPITLSQLLHHTSGLRDQWELLQIQGRNPGDTISQDDVLRALFDQRGLNFAPGERYSYSNSNYTLLALVVERVTKRPFADFVAERIFDPAGMVSARVFTDQGRGRTAQALGYNTLDNGIDRRPLGYTTYGATNIRASVNDLAQWMIHLDQGAIEHVAALDALSANVRDNRNREVRYGAGLISGEYRGSPSLEHGGIDPGFAAYLAILPEQRFGVAVACNTETAPARDLAHRVLDLYLNDVLQPPPATRPTVFLSEREQRPRAGLYIDENDLPFAIEYREGALFAQGDDRLRPVDLTQFESTRSHVVLNFSSDDTLVLRELDTDRSLRKVRPGAASGQDFRPSDYEGAYYSEELRLSVTITNVDEQLQFVAPGRRGPVFQPPESLRRQDVLFSPSPLGWMAFQRDEGGAVNGFTSSNGRVVGLRFVRMETRPAS